MKKLNKFLALLTVLFGTFSASAADISPYKVDFNKTISTSEPDFAVSNGWGHIVGSYPYRNQEMYVSYYYMSSGGVDGSGALRIGSQFYRSSSNPIYDYLVTPAVSGNVTMQVKRNSSAHYLTVYKCTKNSDGSYTLGDKVTLTRGTESSDSLAGFTTSYESVSLGTYTDKTYLAIRGQNIYLDDFEAGTAEVSTHPVIDISHDGEALSGGSTYDFGRITASKTLDLNITNNGDSVLNVTSITAPEGFQVDKNSFTLAPDGATTLTITALVNDYSKHSGSVVLTADGLSPFIINVKSAGRDSTKYYADFEDGKIPAGMLSSNNWDVWDYNISGNKYVLRSTNSDGEDICATPLLKVTAGENLEFDVARQSSSSYLKVYYSTDRKNWTLVETINADQLPDDGDESSYPEKYYLKTFSVSGIPAGNYYIGFGAGNSVIDNIYGYEVVPVEQDVVLSSAAIPASGTANNDLTATATLHNIISKEIPSGTYTATLHLGEQTISVDPVAIAGTSEHEYSFTIVPHTVGTVPAFIEFAFQNGQKLTSDTVSVEIAQETKDGSVQVGTYISTSSSAPIYSYYKNSESQTIYDASMLSELSPGTKITSITYNGYASRSTSINTELSIWLENTTDAAPTASADIDSTIVNSMTKVYSGQYKLERKSSTSSKRKPMIEVKLDKPFVYTGGNLRVVVRSEHQSTTESYYFERTGIQNTWYRGNNNYTTYATNGIYRKVNSPIVVFGVSADPNTISGTVKDTTGTAVSGALIKLSHGNVEYSGRTDESGSYSIPVFQEKLKYSVRVTATGYAPYVVADSLSLDSSIVRNFTLEPATGFFVEGYSIPTTGKVNNGLTASITVTNDITESITAEQYTSELMIGGDSKAQAESKTLEPNATARLDFNYTPHEAGTFPIYIRTTYNGHEYVTPIDTIVISEEDFGGEYTAGDSTGINDDSYRQAPWNNYYARSQSVMVYTPELLGIENGATITSIRFRGNFDSTSRIGKAGVSLYIGNSTYNPAGDTNIDNSLTGIFNNAPATMIQVLDMSRDSIDYPSLPYDSIHDIISAEIPGGLKYTGGNIIVVFSDARTKGAIYDNKVAFVCDESQKNLAYSRATDTNEPISDEVTWDAVDKLPVMYFSSTSLDSIKGLVINKKTGAPVSGTKVLVKSGDVEYKAATDSAGAYSVRMSKGTLTYDVVFSADGFYNDTIKGVTFDISSVVIINDTITPIPLKVNLSGTVSGIQKISGVADRQSAKAITGATIAVKDEQDNILSTLAANETGAYSVDSLTEGRSYKIVFSAAGYVSDSITIAAPDTDFVVSDTLISEKSLVGISGIVRGVQGYASKTADTSSSKPLAGATVTISDANGATIEVLTTDANGGYSADSLKEDSSYVITFTAQGYTDSTATVTAPDSDFVINATLTTQKLLVNAAGTVLGIDLVNGNISDPQPLADATVTVTSQSGAAVATATTSADGTYIIEDLAEDSVYTFTFSKNGYVDSVVTVTAGRADLTVNATLTSEAVTGIAVIENGSSNVSEGIIGGIAKGAVYTIGGQYVGRDVDIRTLQRGVYIIGGHKFTVGK